MNITEVQQEELEAAAQPLMDWMEENCAPGGSASVTATSVELDGNCAPKTDVPIDPQPS